MRDERKVELAARAGARAATKLHAGGIGSGNQFLHGRSDSPARARWDFPRVWLEHRPSVAGPNKGGHDGTGTTMMRFMIQPKRLFPAELLSCASH
jgi:hypothetical protein